MSDRNQSGDGSWTLLTGHGHVLVEIARNPDARIRDISAAAGLTERTVQAIVADLEAAGYITRTRTGRRVRYTVNHDSMFRHPAQEGQRVGPFLNLLAAAEEEASTTPRPDDSEVGSAADVMRAEVWVSSPEPAVGGCVTPGTCQDRL
jgi:MarR family